MFQLVYATDDQIAIWQTEHGHIYLYNVDPETRRLVTGWTHDVDEAPVRAAALEGDALHFAEGEARLRHLIG